MSTTPVADYGPSAPAPAVTNADASSRPSMPRAMPEFEEGMICPACLRQNGAQVELHASCMFMVFDMSCLGSEHGIHPFERAAVLAYARACAKQQPEVARVIRLRVRSGLGSRLRITNRGGRIFVNNKSAHEVRTDPKIVCGHVLTHEMAGGADGDKTLDCACNLLRGHTDKHAFGDFSAEGKFEIHTLWGLSAGARAARLKWSRAKKAFKAEDAAKAAKVAAKVAAKKSTKKTTKKAAKAPKKASKGKRSAR